MAGRRLPPPSRSSRRHALRPPGGCVVVDPMPLPRKGITGKRNQSVAGDPADRGCPIDIDARRPQLPEREQEGVVVASVLGLVAHEPNGAVAARPPRVTHRRCRQGSAGTDLDQDAVRIGQQDVEFVGEPDRCPYLACPRRGIGRLAGGHPGSGDVRQQRYLRLAKRQAGQEAGELRKHRIHQPRMECVRGADPTRDDPLLRRGDPGMRGCSPRIPRRRSCPDR